MARYTYGGKQHDLWIRFRLLILEAKNQKTCEHCGVLLKYPIVHHKSYEWGIFNLDLDNYLILCNNCHENIKLRIEVGLTANAFVHVPFNETQLLEGISEGRCRGPQSNSKARQEKRAQGHCEMSCGSCRGETHPCLDCGYNYCEYHYQFHRGRFYTETDKIRMENFRRSAHRLLKRSNMHFVLNQLKSCPHCSSRVAATSHQ